MSDNNMYAYQTLLEALKHAENDGFQAEMKINDGQLVNCRDNKSYEPKQAKIVRSYRIEGLSDPAEESIVHALVIDEDIKGTLVETYGPNADPEYQAVIQKIEKDSLLS